MPAPLGCPPHDGVLEGVWSHEVHVEVVLSPQLAEVADGIQRQGTEGVIWEGRGGGREEGGREGEEDYT